MEIHGIMVRYASTIRSTMDCTRVTSGGNLCRRLYGAGIGKFRDRFAKAYLCNNKTNAVDTVKVCQEYFNFELPSVLIEKRKQTFLSRLSQYYLVKIS